MGYETFELLCRKKDVTPYRVAQDTGLTSTVFSAWKTGRYVPKHDKLQKVADYFGVSLDYLISGQSEEKTSETGTKYYFDDETAQMAQSLFENKEMRILFDAAKDSEPEDLKMASDLLKRMKEKNANG